MGPDTALSSVDYEADDKDFPFNKIAGFPDMSSHLRRLCPATRVCAQRAASQDLPPAGNVAVGFDWGMPGFVAGVSSEVDVPPTPPSYHRSTPPHCGT